MSKKEINVKVKAELTGISKLRSELNDVKGDLADALSMEDVDPGKIEELTQRAGQLKDQLTEVNEQVDVFATGSKYEAVSKSIGSIGKSMLSLDFGKASARADAFAVAAKKITFKDAIGSVKNLGKTFMTIGKSLITNPLFLLGTIITMIVKAVYEWLDSMGFIQKAIDFLMWPLNLLIDGLKELGDWLGLTDNAGEALAEAEKRRAADRKAVNEALYNSMIGDMDRNIKLMRAQGAAIEDIEDAELELAKVKAATAQQDLKNKQNVLEIIIKTFKAQGLAVGEYVKQLEELKNAAKNATNDLEILEANISKNREDRANKVITDEEKITNKKKEEYKKRKDDTEKFIRDIERREEISRISGLKLSDDLQENELLKAEELAKKRLEWSRDDIDFTKFSKEAKLVYDEWYAGEVIRIEQETIDKKNIIKEQQEIKDESDRERIREDYNKYLYSLVTDEQEIMERAAEEEIDRLRIFLENGLITKEEFADKEKEIKQKLLDDIQAMEEKAIEDSRKAELAANMAKVKMAADAANTINSVIQSLTANTEKGARKQFNANKAFSIGAAAVNTGLAITAALTAGGNPAKLATGAQFVEAGIAGGIGAANIIKIASTKFGSASSGSSSSSSSSPRGGGSSSPTTQRSMPNVSFTGGNNQNSVGAGGEMMSVNAVVSETEMTSVQNKNANRIKNAEL